jgi:integrase
MTFRIKRRGGVYRLEGRHGDRARRGSGERDRLRLSLGTANSDAAQALLSRIERALSLGAASGEWRELHKLLPATTFQRLAATCGYREPAGREASWKSLTDKFSTWMTQRVGLGKLRESTRARYEQTIAAFELFLEERGICALTDISRSVVEDFKAWRLERVLKKKNARGGRGVVLDVAILHRAFGYALECELITRNPVKMEGRPGGEPEHGAQPLNAEQFAKLRAAAGEDLLALLLLRWTGFRGSDAVGLHWGEIDWSTLEINRLTMKRSKRVIVPMHQELAFALEAERERRMPAPDDRVLLNPATGKPLTRPRLYQRMLALGRRAEVFHCHPHRLRDTFAVDLLARGGSPYDVAKLLGDTVETVERHYAPYVRELRERARRILENGQGLEMEITGTPRAQQSNQRGRMQ